jgi:hypothetical protein
MNSEEICKEAVNKGEYNSVAECMDSVHGVKMGGKRRKLTKHKSHKRRTHKRHTRKHRVHKRHTHHKRRHTHHKRRHTRKH